MPWCVRLCIDVALWAGCVLSCLVTALLLSVTGAVAEVETGDGSALAGHVRSEEGLQVSPLPTNLPLLYSDKTTVLY